MAGGEPGERVGQPGLRVDAVQLGGLDQPRDHRPVVAAVVRSREEGVLAAKRDGADGAFDSVAVQLDPAVVQKDYAEVTRRLSGLGIMINGSFVFGMDDDGPDVFDRTVDWAVRHGVTTSTFHIQTPYPGTRLYQAMAAQGRITCHDWDRYDTRHVVYRPAKLTPEELKRGYDRAYRDFYAWRNIARAA